MVEDAWSHVRSTKLHNINTIYKPSRKQKHENDIKVKAKQMLSYNFKANLKWVNIQEIPTQTCFVCAPILYLQ